jgi:hypothetical protein
MTASFFYACRAPGEPPWQCAIDVDGRRFEVARCWCGWNRLSERRGKVAELAHDHYATHIVVNRFPLLGYLDPRRAPRDHVALSRSEPGQERDMPPG